MAAFGHFQLTLGSLFGQLWRPKRAKTPPKGLPKKHAKITSIFDAPWLRNDPENLLKGTMVKLVVDPFGQLFGNLYPHGPRDPIFFDF